MGTRQIRSPQAVFGTMEVRYSPSCQTNWVRAVMSVANSSNTVTKGIRRISGQPDGQGRSDSSRITYTTRAPEARSGCRSSLQEPPASRPWPGTERVGAAPRLHRNACRQCLGRLLLRRKSAPADACASRPRLRHSMERPFPGGASGAR
ncbi:hypothetical protein ABTY00_35725 [Streptomyces microflavus]|uniref:hypothetical protein n=1 Tax=Streptomyces microflavus TaxID=1919 RepID=UPI003323A342